VMKRRFVVADPLPAFAVTWSGQLLSLLGSGLTNFALGLEVYQRSQSIMQFALVNFFFFAPALVLLPFAGALVDRWDRRRAMLIADLGAGMSSLFIFLLIAAGEHGIWPLQVWHFYLPFASAAVFDALRWPAYQSAITLLVPKRHLGRANGLVELSNALVLVVRPLLGGLLVLQIGLRGVVLIDLTTFLIAVGSLLLVRFPPAPPVERDDKRSLLREAAAGWAYVRSRPGLLGLLAFSAAVALVLGFVTVLITPLILSFTDVSSLGVILSVAGVGMLVGGLLASTIGPPRRRMRGVVGFQLLAGLSLLAAGLPPTGGLVMGAAALFLFSVPLTFASTQTIWQSKVPPGLQGRVFALRRMVTLAAPPLAALLCGPLAEEVFEPLMAPGGALAGTVGQAIGTGTGRGIALLFMVLGGLTLINAALAWLSPRVRLVEDELPDALPKTQPPVALGTVEEPNA
jgi:MFS transporter, DHA3 family, macrolide efflux protein